MVPPIDPGAKQDDEIRKQEDEIRKQEIIKKIDNSINVLEQVKSKLNVVSEEKIEEYINDENNETTEDDINSRKKQNQTN